MKIINDSILRNQIDGEYYRVEDMGPDAVIMRRLEATDDGQFNDTPVTRTFSYTDINIAFGVVMIPKKVPDVSKVNLINGEFYVDGKRVSTGSLQITDILGVIPDGIIVSVKSRSAGRADIFLYNTYDDRFAKLAEAVDRHSLVYINGDLFGLLLETDHKIKVLNDKDELVDAVASESEIRFYHGECLSRIFRIKEAGNLVGDNATLIPSCSTIDGKDVFAILSQDFYEYAPNVRDEDECEYDDDDYDEDDCDYIVRHNPDSTHAVIFTVGNDITMNGITFRGTVRDHSFEKGTGNFLFLTDDSIIHTNIGHGYRVASGSDVVNTFKTHPVSVKLCVPSPSYCEFYLSTEEDRDGNRKYAKVSVSKTRDRGYVTKIENI